uniref:Uncharacterized protein n=1 Tax=Fagus sylvatica TaxID=28930 RepID=A0A2N9GAF2_FAGSY
MPLLMSVFKTLISRHFHTLLKPQNPLYFSHKALPISSRFYNTTTSSPHIEHVIETENGNEKQENNKAMDVKFKEAMGLKRRLKKLERAQYNERVVEETRKEPQVYKQLSPDMELFVNHLYKEGYFNNANFLPGNKLEFSCFESKYGQEFIKFAAEKFAKDNQEIANSLNSFRTSLILIKALEDNGNHGGPSLKDPLQVPDGPITRSRAKKIKEAMQGLVQFTWDKANKSPTLKVGLKEGESNFDPLDTSCGRHDLGLLFGSYCY